MVRGARPIRTLVVDDDVGLARFVVEVLTDAGHDARAVHNGRDALALIAPGAWDLVVTDLRMPGMSGLELLARIQTAPRPPALLAMTAFGSAETAQHVRRAGARGYLVKPFVPDALLDEVARCLAAGA